jgi:iron complex transport system substrate-binding protein
VTVSTRFARRLLCTAIAALTVGSLAACATVEAPAASTVSPSAATSTASPSDTSTAAPLADPRTLLGSSTAAAVSSITPIESDVTPSLPVTVTDETGTAVTITDTSRIIALDLYGTLADTVVGLGLGDNLVGRGSTNTSEAMADLPVVTQDGHQLNGEAVLALEPTVVLTDTSIGPREVQDQLRASGVAVVFFASTRTMDSVADQINAVAEALGVDEAGEELAARSVQEIADAQSEIAEMTAGIDPLRIAFLYVRGNGSVFFILGEGSGADDLIASIGGNDVATAAGISGTKPANSEALLALNPELILVMSSGLESTGGLEGLLGRPGVSDTVAGQNHRIVDMNDGQVLSFGPSTGAVLHSLAGAVYAPTELRP